MAGFLFGGNTGVQNAAQLQAQREQVDAMRDRATQTVPTTFGEGLIVIGQALAGRIRDKKLAQKEEAERQRLGGSIGAITASLGGLPMQGAAPIGGASQPAPVAYDPSSPGAIASDTMAAIGKQPKYTPGDKQSFVTAMMPHALRVSERTGIDPRIVIAQAAQETGWGKSAPGNNFFGIKSHGKGGGNTMATNEVISGQTVRIKDSFRGYGDMGQSADDYAQFLIDNPRYKPMLAAQGLDAQIQALGQSGYATDPNYASSIRSIASGIQIPGMGEMPQPVAGGGQAGGANPQTQGNMLQIVQQLSDVVSNPYATEGQRTVAQTLLGQVTAQMQPQDPMKQIELEKAELELAQMREPQPELTATQREYDMARSQGFQGTFLDYQTALAEAKRTQNNVTVKTGQDASGPELLGTSGLVAIPDTTIAEGFRVVPAPGSPLAAEREAQAEAKDKREAQATASANLVLQDIDKAIGQVSGWTAGVGSKLAAIPGTGARDLSSSLDTIKANIGFDRLQQMRYSSPTGGALGGIAVEELRMLQAVLGSLETSQSPDQLRQNLERLRQVYEPIAKKAAAYDNASEFGFGGESAAPAIATQDAIPEGVDPADWEFMSPEERALFK